ncbi:hypothetical protein CAPTEDRAFT_211415 [Capitella teleta]|uniref:Uncharacterized protein n=1 Tax=Capitella teleta TaxID=283909 RepID=R7TU83_CAPTE|nr:hypothetical protein CAPTEDRAFT_211415 [Capitella teleta]|eukprot:ELT97229.1 hypothetical protein CAPTEDRAFT_211415 [Capitella teleta]
MATTAEWDYDEEAESTHEGGVPLLHEATQGVTKVTQEPSTTAMKKETTVAALKTTAATTTEAATTAEPTTTSTPPKVTTQAVKDETTKAPLAETTTKAPIVETTKAPVAETTAKAPIVETPSRITEPPYQIVTEGGIDSTTASNGTLSNEQGGGASAASVGIIAGVVSGLILLVIIVIIVFILLRRRRKRKSKLIVRMENPNYGKSARDYRFSRDSSLYVGPTVDIQSFKPSSDSSPSNSLKKRPAPQPPTSSQKKKRAAPVPPNPFGDDADYYEKDSHGSIESLELSTFTARNDNTKDAEAKEPLMKKNDRNGNLPQEEDSASDQESNNHSTFQPNSLGKSVDEYDKTRNPFFAE